MSFETHKAKPPSLYRSVHVSLSNMQFSLWFSSIFNFTTEKIFMTRDIHVTSASIIKLFTYEVTLTGVLSSQDLEIFDHYVYYEMNSNYPEISVSKSVVVVSL